MVELNSRNLLPPVLQEVHSEHHLPEVKLIDAYMQGKIEPHADAEAEFFRPSVSAVVSTTGQALASNQEDTPKHPQLQCALATIML